MRKCLSIVILWAFALICGAEPVKKPVVFYLKNLPSERIGGLSDERIREELRADGFIVIDVDCSMFPKSSPYLEEALVRFHHSCKEVYSEYENDCQKVDVTNIFYVPEGYTVTRNIPVWNILEHGADESGKWVMDTWNSHIVPHFGEAPVSSPEQMHDREGNPLDWNLYMDVVHPSGEAAAPVPLLLVFGSITPRMASFRPDRTIDRVSRNIFPFGFLTTGYAFAITDHCYNPLVRSWGHFKQYTLDDFNAHASSSAFIRCLRANKERFNLDGRIGVMGVSKASYSAMRVADRSSSDESLLFGGKVNDKPQPWPGEDGHSDVSYVAAGIGAERIFRYVDSISAPIITSAGKHDEYNQWDVYPDVVRHMVSMNHIHLPMWMEDMGHTFPCMGKDYAAGESRYVLFKRFFDNFLKKESADVFYILPAEGRTDVDGYGRSRVVPEDDGLPGRLPEPMLPSAMGYFHEAYPFAGSYAGMLMRLATGERKYVLFRDFFEGYIGHPGDFMVLASDKVFPGELPPLDFQAPVTVRFLTKCLLSEIVGKVKVKDAMTGMTVSGNWVPSMNDTCFGFIPDEPMVSGRVYEVHVPSTIISVSGKSPSVSVIRKFIVN